jgi:hypothetical protein
MKYLIENTSTEITKGLLDMLNYYRSSKIKLVIDPEKTIFNISIPAHFKVNESKINVVIIVFVYLRHLLYL